jgi:hypothetical protein
MSWLCNVPRCGVVLDRPGRCEAHRRRGWETWTAQQPKKSVGYGHKWRKFREAILRERGAVCEQCGATGVPLELPHLDRLGPTGPRGYDPTNVILLCVRDHAAAGQLPGWASIP